MAAIYLNMHSPQVDKLVELAAHAVIETRPPVDDDIMAVAIAKFNAYVASISVVTNWQVGEVIRYTLVRVESILSATNN